MLEYDYTDELYHYGVKGMRWGVRKAYKAVRRAEYPDELNDAVKSLNRHKTKATDKINKLESKRQQLQSKGDSERIKTKISKLESKTEMFRKGLKDIDDALVEADKKTVSEVMDSCGGTMLWNKDKGDWEPAYATGDLRNFNSFDDVLNNYIPTVNNYHHAETVRVKGVNVGSNKNVEIAIDGDDGDWYTPATKEVMSDRIDSAKKFVNSYDDNEMREYVAKEYFDNNTPWSNDPYNGGDSSTKLTRDQFKNEMQLETIRVRPQDETFEAYYYDGGNSYGGHYFVAEGSMRDRKVRYVNLEG